MQPGEAGLVPAGGLAGRFLHALQQAPDIASQLNSVCWSFHECDPLLDSANMSPADWELIALQCQKFESAKALIVVHGTDTLAYTASALAFLLAGFPIPVIITGSQHPLGTANGDALDNLSGAILKAEQADIGVWVYFHKKLMPAARVVKKDALHLDGFSTPRLLRNSLPPPSRNLLSRQKNSRNWPDIQITTVHLQPGYSAIQMLAVLSATPDAIILSLYGLGTLADLDHALLSALRQATEDGVVLVAVSQCYVGHIDFDVYATGQALKNIGILSGRDMTLEAAYSKLMILFRLGYSVAEIKQLFVQEINNEMSSTSA